MWRDFSKLKVTFRYRSGCKALEIQSVEILIGNQEDTNFLQKVIESKGHLTWLLTMAAISRAAIPVSTSLACFEWQGYLCSRRHPYQLLGFEGRYKNRIVCRICKSLIDKMHVGIVKMTEFSLWSFGTRNVSVLWQYGCHKKDIKITVSIVSQTEKWPIRLGSLKQKIVYQFSKTEI